MSKSSLRLNKSDRQARIVAELRATPTLRVNELGGLLDVSTETVRRDLAELDERGLIYRTYGGAMRPVSFEPALAEREALMVAERERIAAAAVKLVESNDILMIGGGATTLHFARRLAAELNHVTIITHAFSVAMALATNPLHKVLMLPGQYDGREGLIHGPDTIDALQRFRANKAFLGASGLTAEGPSDAGVGPGLVYGAMMRRAARAIILADHSKFNQPSLSVYGSWSASTTLVSDTAPEGELAAAIASAHAGFRPA
ncbi:MAG: DeoR/GlpR family DNA-binding transcription regulator [Aestuariivirga sp.]